MGSDPAKLRRRISGALNGADSGLADWLERHPGADPADAPRVRPDTPGYGGRSVAPSPR